jgi:lycopene cyclase domain-containing protein
MSTYLIVNIAAFALPFALSFDRRVAFYRKWPAVFPAVVVVGVLYLVWDVLVTARGDWSFSPEHFGGTTVFGLPVEEILFFVTVPYACLFIYEVVRAYFPERKVAFPRALAWCLAAAAAGGALLLRSRDYSFLVLLSVGLTFALGALFYMDLFRSRWFWLYLAITYVPFFAVNGVLTGLPVVLYNPAQNVGIRVITIPLEDFFYSFSLLALCGMAYASFRRLMPRLGRW